MRISDCGLNDGRSVRRVGGALLAVVLGSSSYAQTSRPAAETDPSWQSYLAHIAAAETSLRVNESAEARRWLDAAPREHRGWEWRHLNAVADESVETVIAGDDPVGRMAISPEGARIAVAVGAEAHLWDLRARKEAGRLEGHTGDIYSLCFNADGSRLVSASRDRTARLWDVSAGACITIYKQHNNTVAAAAFSPDGRRVATCSYERPDNDARVEGVVHLWDPDSGETKMKLVGGRKPLSCVCFTPDGRAVAAGSWDSYVFVWDVATGGEPRTFGQLRGEDSSFHLDAIAFSPDGTLLAATAKEKWTRVWRFDTGQQVAELTAHAAEVTAAAFSPDGRTLATGGYDDAVRLWDTVSWEVRGQLRGHRAAIGDLAWMPDGSRLVSSSADGTVRAWDPSYRHYGGLKLRHEPACYAAPFSPDGQHVATCSYDGSLALWSAKTGEQVARWTAHPDGPACTVVFSADGKRLASCSWDKTARIFDAAAQKELKVLNHDAGVALAAFSPDNVHLATALTNKNVAIWNADTGEVVHTLTGHEGRVNTVVFSADGKLLASSSGDRTVRTWDMQTGKAVAVMRGHEDTIESCAFSPDGTRVVSGSGDGSVRHWDARSGELIRPLHEGDESIHRVAFSPDGGRAVAATTTLLVLDVSRGGVVARLRPHADAIWSLAFSADGKRLATCSWDGTISILESVPLRDRLHGGMN